MKPFMTAFLLICSLPLVAKQKDYSSDVASAERIVSVLYEVISGGKGVERDWDRFRNLFAPGARMLAVVGNKEKMQSVALTPEDYVKRAGPVLVRDGFFEKEVGRKVDSYGPVVQVMTAYESRKTEIDEKPFETGVNFLQLTFDGKRWWVQSIAWSGDDLAGPIPRSLIGNGLPKQKK